ncbi:hypothetical protein PTSG_00196 [Salpingoeca rosetta]|uniref:Kinesin motor domain-containing protein n=1 Tax=Salpingoeca rosetta (strain ATCC 50818 / BSB-021) TaxID=946362 RepID=F2TVS7_SALR5|nr:uncharacterized protein PTSG_00196 [Salpingoeca rosetta]EGD72173.1 hypothetical protein PTSG_00196 [Salpingoeca rosetta]|eukprot:XP_004998745.1 hypothetical protein PTSG_00196 [Salpingoeca rosetta]
MSRSSKIQVVCRLDTLEDSDDQVAAVPVEDDTLRINDDSYQLTRVFGGEASNRIVANYVNKKPIECFMDGFNASTIAFGASANDTIFGSSTSPGCVYYAIEQIHTRMRAAGGADMWQLAIGCFCIVQGRVVDMLSPEYSRGAHRTTCGSPDQTTLVMPTEEVEAADIVNTALDRHQDLAAMYGDDTCHLVLRFALYDTTLKRGAYLTFVHAAGLATFLRDGRCSDAHASSDARTIVSLLEQVGQAKHAGAASTTSSDVASSPAAKFVATLLNTSFIGLVACVGARESQATATTSAVSLVAPLAVAKCTCTRVPSADFEEFAGTERVLPTFARSPRQQQQQQQHEYRSHHARQAGRGRHSPSYVPHSSALHGTDTAPGFTGRRPGGDALPSRIDAPSDDSPSSDSASPSPPPKGSSHHHHHHHRHRHRHHRHGYEDEHEDEYEDSPQQQQQQQQQHEGYRRYPDPRPYETPPAARVPASRTSGSTGDHGARRDPHDADLSRLFDLTEDEQVAAPDAGHKRSVRFKEEGAAETTKGEMHTPPRTTTAAGGGGKTERGRDARDGAGWRSTPWETPETRDVHRATQELLAQEHRHLPSRASKTTAATKSAAAAGGARGGNARYATRARAHDEESVHPQTLRAPPAPAAATAGTTTYYSRTHVQPSGATTTTTSAAAPATTSVTTTSIGAQRPMLSAVHQAEAARKRAAELLRRYSRSPPSTTVTTTTTAAAPVADEERHVRDIRGLRRRAEVREATDAYTRGNFEIDEELQEIALCGSIRDKRRELESVDGAERHMSGKGVGTGGSTTTTVHFAPSSLRRQQTQESGRAKETRTTTTTYYGGGLASSQRRVETVTTTEEEPNIDHVRVRILEEENADLKQQLATLRDEKRAAEEECLQMCAERDDAKRERTTYEAHFDAMQSDCNAQKDLVAQLSRELEEAKEELAAKTRALKEQKERHVDVADQLEKAGMLSEEFQAELQRCREENQKLRKDNVALAQREEATTAAHAQLESELEDVSARLAAAQEEVQAKKETIRELRGANISLEQQTERQTRKIESLRNELELAAVSHDTLRQQVKDERGAVKKLRGEAHGTAQQLGQVQDELDKVRVERDSLRASLTDADENGQRLQAQVEAFRAKLEAMVKRVEGYKKQRALFLKEQQQLLKILAAVHSLVDAAGAHASKCQARGFFALKSRKLHEDLQRVMDSLMDHIIESSSKLSSRKDILQQLKEMQLF